jgi:type III secretory pathway component EscR
MAAVFNLNHHATYVHFHIGGGSTPFFVFDMSLSNVLLIVAMLLVFVAAIALPFPHHQGAGTRS